MPGIVGDSLNKNSISTMMDSITYGKWQRQECYNTTSPGLGLVNYGHSNPGENVFWQNNITCSAIYGSVINLEELGFINYIFNKIQIEKLKQDILKMENHFQR